MERIHRAKKIPADMVGAVRVMDKSTQRMLRLINQLLEFRKMQNNKLSLSLEETDVIAFLREIYLIFKDAAESKNMEYVFSPSVSTYKMFIDKSNIDKVAYNLLSNAFKYTPSNKRIEFSVSVDEVNHKLIMKSNRYGSRYSRRKAWRAVQTFYAEQFFKQQYGGRFTPYP